MRVVHKFASSISELSKNVETVLVLAQRERGGVMNEGWNYARLHTLYVQIFR